MDTPPEGLLSQILAHRPMEVWAALVGGCLYVWQKSESVSRVTRTVEAGVSGLMGYSIGPDASAWAGISPEISAFLLTAVGYMFLDGVRALIKDRAVLRDMILKFLGGNKDAK